MGDNSTGLSRNWWVKMLLCEMGWTSFFHTFEVERTCLFCGHELFKKLEFQFCTMPEFFLDVTYLFI